MFRVECRTFKRICDQGARDREVSEADGLIFMSFSDKQGSFSVLVSLVQAHILVLKAKKDVNSSLS